MERGWGSIVRKTPDTALYSTFKIFVGSGVPTILIRPVAGNNLLLYCCFADICQLLNYMLLLCKVCTFLEK